MQRDGVLFNSMLKCTADISKLPESLCGNQILTVTMLLNFSRSQVVWLGIGKAD